MQYFYCVYFNVVLCPINLAILGRAIIVNYSIIKTVVTMQRHYVTLSDPTMHPAHLIMNKSGSIKVGTMDDSGMLLLA